MREALKVWMVTRATVGAGVSLYTLPAASPPGHYKTRNDSVVLVNQPG